MKFRISICILFVSFACGCGMFSARVPEIDSSPPSAVPDQELSSILEGVEPDSPLTLTILDEVNDGDLLHVLASVSAETNWSRKDVLLRLTGLREGEVIHRADYRLDAVEPTTVMASQTANTSAHKNDLIRAGQKINLSLAIPSDGISDYQLELLWGKDAQPIEPVRSAGQLRIQHLEVEGKREGCEPGPCEIAYTFSGELFNAGQIDIHEAELGVGFIWLPSGQKLDLSNRIPENETPVHISELNLKPGERKPLRLALDRTVPESGQGSYQPVLRILSFNGMPAR